MRAPRVHQIAGCALLAALTACDARQTTTTVDMRDGAPLNVAPYGPQVVVADLLGESVVWFRLAPVEPGGVVEFGPIVALDVEVATLADGLQLPYARVLTRRCDTEFESFSAFRRELGEVFM